MTTAKSLCLNMIVKNEMANLARCLGAVAPYIDCWVIGDTGSADGTQDFIKEFFAARNLPGELHSFPFHNFEQARNAALDCAYASPLAYDYLLLDDADMELVVEDEDFRTRLEATCYTLLQRSGVSYWNARIVRRNAGARYHGVTHEYLSAPDGAKQLHGVWYKDHASGSNRAEKFERDIRLLREGLKQEPDSHRYWFYLAQSYRDAGQTEQAAEAYAKRAEMGGWDEEAWYARLQLARCQRKLGDEGGFVRHALAAFNQRPHRGEPLYDLARFYRERGMNEASVLFSEDGIGLSPPDRDTLFIEDFVYQTGFKEEYSISANYSRDPARNDRGFAACNWLALNREVAPDSRGLALSNLRFYVEPASAMMPSFSVRPIEFDAPQGYRLMNPSIAVRGGQLVLALRCYKIAAPDNPFRIPKGTPAHTRNFLVKLKGDLVTESSAEILMPENMSKFASKLSMEFEDLRLFVWRDELWCCAGIREPTANGAYAFVLARLDESSSGTCRLTEWRVLRPDGRQRDEQNWMPRVSGETLEFVHSCDPTRVVDDRARTVTATVPAIAAESFRGGTQVIPFEHGWLAVIHETRVEDGKRSDWHRFVGFDKATRLRSVSRPFVFHKFQTEFAAGLAWHPDGRRLLISYGMDNREPWIGTVDAAEVAAVLEDVERLPYGAPSNRSSPPTALPPGKMRTDKHDRVTNITVLASGEIHRQDVPIQLNDQAVAKVQSVAKARSAWVPEAPAAGTELMVSHLRERMGDDLAQINLQVNHPGHDMADKRPRVVWMHHDTNQRWVQWCSNKELVASVDCFVFVSYWQREKYLNAFGLPPQRCVVLRHALDLGADLRLWVTESLWRCAYTSTPFRGLSVLLDGWKRLSPANAELHIWSSMKLYLEDDAPYRHLYDRAESMPGVFYHGIAPNPELREALRRMHFLVYPCTFPETACLSVIEAMAAGCRVIVPSLGALPETTGGYARVYPSTPDAEDHAAAFAETLATELATPWAGNPELSLSQQAHCSATYDWPRRLGEWRQLIGSLRAQVSRPGVELRIGAA